MRESAVETRDRRSDENLFKKPNSREDNQKSKLSRKDLQIKAKRLQN